MGKGYTTWGSLENDETETKKLQSRKNCYPGKDGNMSVSDDEGAGGATIEVHDAKKKW